MRSIAGHIAWREVLVTSAICALPFSAAWAAKKTAVRSAPVSGASSFQSHSKGVDLVARGKCKEALSFFEEANRINPAFSSAWLERGRCLVLLGDRAKAIAVMGEGIKRAPRGEDQARLSRELHTLSEFFYTNETFQKCQDGLNLLRKGMAEEAVESLQEALVKEPENTLVLTSLGRARILAAMKDKAREPLEKALELNPERVDAKELLGQLLWDKEPARVLDLLEPLSRKRGAGEDTVLFAALAMAQMKRTRDATELLRSHVEERGDWLRGTFWLGKLLAEDKKNAWAARKYLMTFQRRLDGYLQLRADLPLHEREMLKSFKTESDLLLSRVNDLLQ